MRKLALLLLLLLQSCSYSTPGAAVYQAVDQCKRHGDLVTFEVGSFNSIAYCNDGATFRYDNRDGSVIVGRKEE